MPESIALSEAGPTATSVGSPSCVHCGTLCKPEVVWSSGKAFCCHGCAGVFSILSDSGLAGFYQIERTPGLRQGDREMADYTVLDEASVRERLVEFNCGTTTRVRFRLPAIHCVACVWLLENLHRVQPGVGRVEVNFVRREAMIQFDNTELSLVELAEGLDRIGYPPELSFDDLDVEAAPRDHRGALQLGVAGFAFGNIMLLALPGYFGLETASSWARGFAWIQGVLAIPVLTFCARDFFVAALNGLRQRRLSIDLPIALGIAALFLHSVIGGLILSGEPYFDSLAGLVFFLLIGRWFQRRTYDALSFDRDYRSFFPLSSVVVTPDGERATPLDHLQVGDRLRITYGELIPADAVLRAGEAQLDYHFVTGESEPVSVEVGERCQAGGRQCGAAIEVELSHTVERSYLASLWDQSVHANEADHAWDALTERVGQVFTVVVLVLAVLTGLVWLALDPGQAVWSVSAVLIVACPCALALAGPFSFGSAMRMLARRGVHLKNATVVERMGRINRILFDKTGTLTASGEQARWVGDDLSDTHQRYIASAAAQSAHPVSVALRQTFEGGAALCEVTEFEEILGEGVTALVDGHEVRLGTASFTGQEAGESDRAAWVAIDGQALGGIVLEQQLREGLAEAVRSLDSHAELEVLSGDRPRLVDRLRSVFGSLAPFTFECRPHEKRALVTARQAEGDRVMMVGDGLNDAGALQQSDVGLAVSDDLHRFSPACDALMQAGSLRYLAQVLTLASASRRVVKVCFVLSFAYNIVGLSLAATGRLSPLAAAILMPLSSITVVALASSLTHWQGRRLPPPVEVAV